MRRTVVFLVPGLLLAAQPAAPQVPAVQQGAADLAKPLPFDTAWTVGKLDNGLIYFIRANKRPENRAELRLAVNVGAVQEADDQQGLAHVTEHMAFNGTEHFKKQELVHYMQSIGMRFGADVNAYTNPDETVYMLTVPTDTGKFLENGIQILADWAHAQLFDSAEVEAERGVVIEEWRLGRGANGRIRDKQFPVVFNGSRYAARNVIGDAAYLRTFPQAALKRFYRDWYRPDLMAVVVVGDIDKAVVERLVRDRFGVIPRPATPLNKPLALVPPHDSTYVTVATDKEQTNSVVVVYNLLPIRDQSTVGSYRQQMVDNLYSAMLGARYEEITQKPNAPFVAAGAGRFIFVRSSEASQVFVGVPEGGALRGFEAALTEAERVRRFGFTASELERAKTDLLRGAERINAERERRQSGSHAAEMIRHFLEGESVTGGQVEYALHQQLLPGITLAEVNALARETLSAANRVITVAQPDKPGLAVPTEAELLAVDRTVKAKTLEPYVDAVSTAPLLARIPAPAAISAEKKIPEIGVTELTLANGVHVVLKPTDFQADQILLSGTSPGGSSLLPDSNYVSGTVGNSAVVGGGIGQFSVIDLQKMLTGKIAQASVGLGGRTELVNGSASPKDVETMFQLVYLRFTSPRRDSAAWVAQKQGTQAFLSNRAASPQAAFQDTVQVTMAQHNFRARPFAAATLDEVNLDRALAIYRDRFADASDFTFFIVGNFNVDSIKPLVQRYLGGLPSLNRKEAGRDVGIRPPTGNVERVVRRGVEPQSQSYMAYTGAFQWTRENAYVLSSMAEVLQLRLLDQLREALGGTYSVSASAGGTRDVPQQYTITVRFGSAPDRAEELTRAVLKEIQRLKDSGATAADLEKVKETQHRGREAGLKQNGTWAGLLNSAYTYGDDPRIILTYDAMVNGLTSAAIRDAARKYFGANYVHITLLPETTPKP
jgi:zinc protease